MIEKPKAVEPKAEEAKECKPTLKLAKPEQPQPAVLKRLVIVSDGKKYDVQVNVLNDIEMRYLGSLLVNFKTV